MTLSIEREVAWGESREGGIVKRWLSVSEIGRAAVRVVKSSAYDDFDFYLFAKNGFPLCYLEVKARTIRFDQYGDAMFPYRKHEYAKRMWDAHLIPVLAVTEYACGSLVECDLRAKPKQKRDVKRRDRPDTPAVPHAFYLKAQMRVLEEG